MKIRHIVERNRFRNQALNNQLQVSTLFETDDDLIKMRRPFKSEFFHAFANGMHAYTKGQWSKAREIFKTVEVIK